MIQKWTFVAYVISAVALGYAALVNSPMRFASQTWENTATPATFFGICVILIIHIVVSGKMLSQEKFRKVLWTSFWITLFAGFILIPGVTMIPQVVLSYIR
jgi:hypothetical protein